ncbi:MAG: phage integrase SAM-like domain-containing protein [Pirellulales bacterium]
MHCGRKAQTSTRRAAPYSADLRLQCRGTLSTDRQIASSVEIRDFVPEDGGKYRKWLLSKGLAENTVRRNCGRAKQFFRVAIRRRLVTENPFADLAVGGNPARLRVIDLEMSAKVLAACRTFPTGIATSRRFAFKQRLFAAWRCKIRCTGRTSR